MEDKNRRFSIVLMIKELVQVSIKQESWDILLDQVKEIRVAKELSVGDQESFKVLKGFDVDCSLNMSSFVLVVVSAVDDEVSF